MKTLVYIALFLILVSCEKEIVINLDKHESKLVVNSFFAPSDGIKINLTKSIQVLEIDTVNYVKDANVRFIKGGDFVGIMDYIGDGNYSLNTPINTGEEYTIEIDAPGINSVTANSVIPEEVLILSLDTMHVDSRVLYTEIEFNVNQKKTNFYLLELVSKYPILDKDSVYTNQMDIVKSDVIIENGALGDMQKRFFFSGKRIKEATYALGFAFDKESLENSFVDGSNTIYVVFKNISEDYYLYLKSYYGFVPNLNEIFTNITNGYGIFAGYSVAVDSIVMYNNRLHDLSTSANHTKN